MRFIDEVKIQVSSGSGGHGCVSFRREKFVPYGGPDGGDGGDGGGVFFITNNALNTLQGFRGQKNFFAKNGDAGAGSRMHGCYGDNMYLEVPVGTIVRNQVDGEVLADLTDNEQKFCIAEGGRGGLGNYNFRTSTNQTPRHATMGKDGQTFELELELKLLADIALIGLPNAGKSTLISSVSGARPKIADYPFTTLQPNLGVVEMGENSFVIADIPGLIEDASIGKGLGIKFLKHIERTSSFIHLVDVSWCLDEFEAFESYITIRNEIEKFNPELLERREIVCLTKVDAMTEEEVTKFQTFFEEQLGKKVLPISSVSQKNIDQLKTLMLNTIKKSRIENGQ
jgi:GTP-binding protein